MEKRAQVIILLGPVGAGKSTVGRFLESELKGCFLAIEEFFLQKFGSYEAYSENRDQAYLDFAGEIRSAIALGKVPVIFEEIAISPQGQRLIENIQKNFSAEFMCIDADLSTCQSRAKARGTSKNFPKSAETVEYAWRAFAQIKRSFAYRLEVRNQDISEQALFDQILKAW